MNKETENKISTLKGRVDVMCVELDDIIRVMKSIQDKENNPDLQETINKLEEAYHLLYNA